MEPEAGLQHLRRGKHTHVNQARIACLTGNCCPDGICMHMACHVFEDGAWRLEEHGVSGSMAILYGEPVMGPFRSRSVGSGGGMPPGRGALTAAAPLSPLAGGRLGGSGNLRPLNNAGRLCPRPCWYGLALQWLSY